MVATSGVALVLKSIHPVEVATTTAENSAAQMYIRFEIDRDTMSPLENFVLLKSELRFQFATKAQCPTVMPL